MHLPNQDFGKDWIILLENPAKVSISCFYTLSCQKCEIVSFGNFFSWLEAGLHSVIYVGDSKGSWLRLVYRRCMRFTPKRVLVQIGPEDTLTDLAFWYLISCIGRLKRVRRSHWLAWALFASYTFWVVVNHLSFKERIG